MVGYIPTEVAGIKRGDWVRVRKGAHLWTTGPQRERVAGKAYAVRVHHVNPYGADGVGEVVWPGAGGYWYHASVEDVEKVSE